MSIELLRRCPLFAGLKEDDLKRIRAIASLRQIEKKKVLFSDGEEARGFYVILSGKVKLFKVSPEGKEQILHIVSAARCLCGSGPFSRRDLSSVCRGDDRFSTPLLSQKGFHPTH
jgi:CRP/FNR family transcriptional regulator